MVINDICSLFFALALGSLGAGGISCFAGRLGLLDHPCERSSHRKITPKGGGVGLLAAFLLLSIQADWPLFLVISTAVLSLVSLLGDKIEISPGLRLVFQFAAAGIVCESLIYDNPAINSAQWIGTAFWLATSVFFIVGTSNVYNFMDGINGIAGLTGIVAFGLLALTGWWRGEAHGWVVLAAGMSFACVGFLPWNFPRAKVFMGDVGSILLGFLLAIFVVAWSRTLADFFLFSSFLFPFYADEGVTLLARLKSREPLTKPHRRHLYQILVNQKGIAHWKISSLYGLIQLILGMALVGLHPWGWLVELSCLALASVLFFTADRYIRHWERYQ